MYLDGQNTNSLGACIAVLVTLVTGMWKGVFEQIFEISVFGTTRFWRGASSFSSKQSIQILSDTAFNVLIYFIFAMFRWTYAARLMFWKQWPALWSILNF